MMLNTGSRVRTGYLLRLPRRMLRLVVIVLSGHAYLNRHLSVMRVVYNPNCNHCEGAYETAAHFIGEYDRYASLRREIWIKPYLYPNDFSIFNSRRLGEIH